MKLIFNKENFRFAFFVYLFNICFITSLIQCIYFLSYYSRNSNINLFGYSSFIVVVLIAVFSFKFRHFYLTLVFNEMSMKFILKLKEILAKGQKHYSYTCFILFHFYVAFSIFHFMMIFFYEIDITFELIYQFLNVIRLFFFPLALLAVTLNFYPDFFRMEGLLHEGSQKAINQAVEQLLEFLKQSGNIKKNPKTAFALYTVTGVGIGAVAHKNHLQQQFEQSCKRLDINVTEIPSVLLGDPVGIELYKSVLTTISQVDQSAVAILASDVKNFLTKNPTLREQLSERLVKFKSASAVAEAQAGLAREKAAAISMSPTAKITYDSEMNSSSSEVSKIPTIIEKLVFEN